MVGRSIAHYRVLELIGQGGMGEVYLAEDTKLDRRVALKFLPLEMEESPLARKRFLREARSAAALEHPFIAHIYEVGEENGRSFIAMEYVAGTTLDRRLKEGPLPLEEALQIASEIAEALHEAHRKGIIHRDLKPSNILLMKGGHVKVTDFGLAKLVQISHRPSEGGDVLTGLTSLGAPLGTIPYMSPEQLKGEALDTRSDIFPFGILLHEMLCGVHPFRRPDTYETAGAILRDEPPSLTQFEPSVSEVLSYVLRKMLAKRPEHRYQSVLEVQTDLLGLLREVRLSTPSGSTLRRLGSGSVRRRLWWALLPVLIVAFLAGSFVSRRAGSQPRDQYHLEVSLPPGERLAHYYRTGLAVDPNGAMLALVSGSVANPYIFPERTRIYVRRFDEWQPRPLAGTERGFQPFFSPDGRWLGFTQQDPVSNRWYLKKIRVEGGEPITLCECEARWGASWGTDGTIVFGADSGGLRRVSDAGGEPYPITEPDREKGEVGHRLPFIVPGGKAILYTAPLREDALASEALVYAYFPATGERSLLAEGWDGRYVPSGHVIYGREGSLKAVAVDPETLAVRSAEFPVLDGVTHSLFTVNPGLRTGAMQLAFSETGILAYASGSVFPEIRNTLVWVDRQGGEEPLEIEGRNYFTIRVSDSGRRLLLTTIYPPQDVWLHDLERKTSRRQTFDGNAVYAVWGPTPDRFTFVSDRGGPRALFTKLLDSGPVEPDLLRREKEGFLRPNLWSRDGRFLSVVGLDPETRFDLGLLSPDGTLEMVLNTRFSEQYPELSPDGRWLVYSSNESGRQEVYVRPYPGDGRAVQISTGGGIEPAWSRDGGEIFYRSRNEFFAVRVQANDGSLTVGLPVKLFEGDYGSVFAVRSYDIAPDGRFLVLKRPDEATMAAAVGRFFPDRVGVVLNWLDELGRRAPVSTTGLSP
jgi:eukaryotic-like serine/threonine-protein kinase